MDIRKSAIGISVLALLLIVAGTISMIAFTSDPKGDGWIIPATYAGFEPGADADKYNHRAEGIIAGTPFSLSEGMETAYYLTTTAALPEDDACATLNPEDTVAVSLRKTDGIIDAVACQSVGALLTDRDRSEALTLDLGWANITWSQSEGLGTLALHETKQGEERTFILHWSQASNENALNPFSRKR